MKADPQTTFDIDIEKLNFLRNPEIWIEFRAEHPDIPLALLIKDIQKQAIVAYRKEMSDDRTI